MLDTKQFRILVVAQDLGTLSSLDSLLTREGYPVTICSSATAALRAVSRLGIDLVLAGTESPDIHGIALVAKIKSASPTTRVALLQGPGRGPSHYDLVAAGTDGLLTKPFSDLQALQSVERLLTAPSRPQTPPEPPAPAAPPPAQYKPAPPPPLRTTASPGAAPVAALTSPAGWPASSSRRSVRPFLMALTLVALVGIAFVVATVVYTGKFSAGAGLTPLKVGQIETVPH